MNTGRDKILHASVCCAIEIVLAILGFWNPFMRYIFVVFCIGGTKEVYDYCHDGHDAEWADIAADAVGAIIGEIAYLLLF